MALSIANQSHLDEPAPPAPTPTRVSSRGPSPAPTPAGIAPSATASTSPAPVPSPASNDPGFAPFADLGGLLKIAQNAEARLRIQFHPKHPQVNNLKHLDDSVQTLHRLTAVRKTLIELYRISRAPFPGFTPNPNARSSSDEYANKHSEQNPNSSAHMLSGAATPHPATAPSSATLSHPSPPSVPNSPRTNISSIPSIPIIRSLEDPARALGLINETLDKLEQRTKPTHAPTPDTSVATPARASAPTSVSASEPAPPCATKATPALPPTLRSNAQPPASPNAAPISLHAPRFSAALMAQSLPNLHSPISPPAHPSLRPPRLPTDA